MEPLPTIIKEGMLCNDGDGNTPKLWKLSAFTPEQYGNASEKVANLSPKMVLREMRGYLEDHSYPWQEIRDWIQIMINKGALELIPHRNLNIPWEWDELCWEKENWEHQCQNEKNWEQYQCWVTNNEEVAAHFRHRLTVLRILPELEKGPVKRACYNLASSGSDLFIHERRRSVADTPFMTLKQVKDETFEDGGYDDGDIGSIYDDPGFNIDNTGYDGEWGYFDEYYGASPYYSETDE